MVSSVALATSNTGLKRKKEKKITSIQTQPHPPTPCWSHLSQFSGLSKVSYTGCELHKWLQCHTTVHKKVCLGRGQSVTA